MTNKIIIFLLGFVLMSGTYLYSQSNSTYNMYNIEAVLLNPAAAGLSKNPTVFFDYRKQWAGIQGAPEIASGAIHGLVVKNMGVGLNFNSYRSSIFSIFSASLNYAYVVKISENQTLIPGVSVGLKQTTLNKGGLSADELADPAISSDAYEKFFVTSGFGFRYKFKDLTLDFAIPNLYSGEEKQIAGSVLGFAAYDFFTKDDSWRIQPSVLYRYEQTEKALFDINFLLEYDKLIWLQTGYRTNKDVNIMLGVNYKSIGIAYNYSITNSGMENISGGSHEIAILYTLPYSFLK